MSTDSSRNFKKTVEDTRSASTALHLDDDDADIFTVKNIKKISGIIRALNSPLRIEIIMALNQRPHHVHELVKLVNSSQPLVSQHLKVLKSSGIVEAARQGRQMTYSLSQPLALDIFRIALQAANTTTE
ncbi:hypothetical protein CDES_10320 [Corynebacterium deserti GIMN1.010]|uniref:HTH arsR-type domain-containing protein n=1 Tax=Corynebacterium deserti GIMN1.010 TaxID=931089 RepID=A0A0M4CES7_9CORY|nr:metalloregulator ArsR/SmtB family transcription factor [Corynebacterium deserti]ALC06441.1 hypothetical protein CDES_10320 [Corynebacterium deserti GIMN1.010]